MTGNILILRAISVHKELQTPTNMFLASLAVSDLLTTLYSPIGAVSINYGNSKLTSVRFFTLHDICKFSSLRGFNNNP